jgi:hypothetical protein
MSPTRSISQPRPTITSPTFRRGGETAISLKTQGIHSAIAFTGSKQAPSIIVPRPANSQTVNDETPRRASTTACQDIARLPAKSAAATITSATRERGARVSSGESFCNCAELNAEGGLTMRLSDAGLHQRRAKTVYPDHPFSPWLTEDAARDRSNRLLDPCGGTNLEGDVPPPERKALRLSKPHHPTPGLRRVSTASCWSELIARIQLIQYQICKFGASHRPDWRM